MKHFVLFRDLLLSKIRTVFHGFLCVLETEVSLGTLKRH